MRKVFACQTAPNVISHLLFAPTRFRPDPPELVSASKACSIFLAACGRRRRAVLRPNLIIRFLPGLIGQKRDTQRGRNRQGC